MMQLQEAPDYRCLQGIVFVVKAIEPLSTALLAIPLLSQTFNLRLLRSELHGVGQSTVHENRVVVEFVWLNSVS